MVLVVEINQILEDPSQSLLERARRIFQDGPDTDYPGDAPLTLMPAVQSLTCRSIDVHVLLGVSHSEENKTLVRSLD